MTENCNLYSEENCMICNSKSLKPMLLNCYDFYLKKSKVVDYYFCQVCEYVQQVPMPSFDEILSYYDEYPIHRKKNWIFDLARNLVNQDCYLDPAVLKFKSPSEIKILDYGCGDGSYINKLKKKYKNVLGYEPNEVHAKNLSDQYGVVVYSDTTRLLDEQKSSFDLITLNFVVEHIADINALFKMMENILSPNGYMVFTVPNINSFERKIFGRYWHCLDAPRHIGFVSNKTVQLLCHNHNLKLYSSKYVGFANGIAGSLSTVLCNKFNYILFVIFLPIGYLLSKISPNGNVRFILKKPHELSR